MTRAAWRMTPFEAPVRYQRRREAPNAKLTEAMVRCIKRAHRGGCALDVLCLAYPEVSERAIKDILLGRAWRWVKADAPGP